MKIRGAASLADVPYWRKKLNVRQPQFYQNKPIFSSLISPFGAVYHIYFQLFKRNYSILPNRLSEAISEP